MPGLGLGRNATLRTGIESLVRMTCPYGLDLVVGPDCEIAVSRFLEGAARPFGLRPKDGIARSLIYREGGDGVQVLTPSAVAAIRSTEWAMRVEKRTSAVIASKWAVFFAAGDGVDMTSDGGVGRVKWWGQKRIDLLGPGWQGGSALRRRDPALRRRGTLVAFGMPDPAPDDPARALLQVGVMGGLRHRHLSVSGDAVKAASRALDVARASQTTLALSNALVSGTPAGIARAAGAGLRRLDRQLLRGRTGAETL